MSISSENSRWRSGEKSPWRHESSTGSPMPATSGTSTSFRRAKTEATSRRPHARLVVVEERVVRIVERLVARDVLARELEPPLEMRAEDLVVRRLARLEPRDVAERAGARHLGAQVARNATLLLVVAARDADDARLERLRLGALLERAQLLEQLAELGRRGASSCASRASVASCSARAGAPSGGIFVSWSQPRR